MTNVNNANKNETVYIQINPSQDSSIGSISAWYWGGQIPGRARIFQ